MLEMMLRVLLEQNFDKYQSSWHVRRRVSELMGLEWFEVDLIRVTCTSKTENIIIQS